MDTLNKQYKGGLKNPQFFYNKDYFTLYFVNAFLGDNNNGDGLFVSLYSGYVTSKVGFISNGTLYYKRTVSGGTIEVKPSNTDFTDITFEGIIKDLTISIKSKNTEIYIPNFFCNLEKFAISSNPIGQHGRFFIGLKHTIGCQDLTDLRLICDEVVIDGDVKDIRDLNLNSLVFLSECGIKGDIKYIPSNIRNLQIPNSNLYGNIKDLKLYNATNIIIYGNNIQGDIKDFFDECFSHGRSSGTLKLYSDLNYDKKPMNNCQATFTNSGYTVTQL